MTSKPVRFAAIALSILVLLSAPVLARSVAPAGSCSNASLTGNYGFIVNGTADGSPVTTVGQISTDGNGSIAGSETVSLNGAISQDVELLGSYHINSNCSGTATINPAGQSAVNFSVTIITGGKQIQMVETDQGTTISGNAYAQGVSKCTLGGVKGVYGLQGGGIEIGSGPLVYGGQINLKANGTLSGSENGSINGTIFTGAKVSGAYKVGKPCTGGAKVFVGQNAPIGLSLVYVNSEKGVLFIQTDATTLSAGLLQQ
jgi:hypothetical protein